MKTSFNISYPGSCLQ